MIMTSLIHRARAFPKKRILLIVGLAVIGIALRDQLPAAILYALSNLWQIAPIALAGLVVAAALTASGAISILKTAFDSHEIFAIVTISLIGAVLPVCGFSLLPLVAGLLSAGVSLAPIMAFLLSSAVTDPELIAVTGAVVGWPFALGKTVAALGIGLLGGGATLALMRIGWFAQPARQSPMFHSLIPHSACDKPTEVRWQFWRHAERLIAFRDTAWGLAKLVVLWLSIAFVAEYFLKLYLPENVLIAYVGQDNPFSVPIAAIVGAPMYLDGHAALPLVRGMMDHGMAEGAAMAFVISGGIVSAWTAIPVLALVRPPVFIAYVVMAITGAMLSGWLYAIAVA